MFEDATVAEHSKWVAKPRQLVPESLLPLVKAGYNFTGRYARSEDYATLNKQILPVHAEPTLAHYRAQMLALRNEARRTGENYLSI